MEDFRNIFKEAKAVAPALAGLSDEKRKAVLLALADEIDRSEKTILEANGNDLSKMSPDNPCYDRLALSGERLRGISSDMRRVASLESPTGKILSEKTMSNGLRIRKISVPFGVIGIVFEARPNVTFDVFSLCFKSGNVCILKGGKDAEESNEAEVEVIKRVLKEQGVSENVISLLPSSHESVGALLSAVGLVDLVIPRGGKRLIDFVRNNAKVPVIETGAGVVNTYFDKDGNLEIGKKIVENAKTRRTSVCNALDCLIVHKDRLSDLFELCSPLAKHGVTLHADKEAYSALEGKYNAEALVHADETTFGTEFLSLNLGIKTVDSIDEALEHVARFGSGHSECIVTENESAAERFRKEVDAACVYVNAPTSFTDGGQFGLGAEIGISTQKLGARGPMGLEEITTYKWLIDGNGQVRP